MDKTDAHRHRRTLEGLLSDDVWDLAEHEKAAIRWALATIDVDGLGKIATRVVELFSDSEPRVELVAPEDAEVKELCDRVGYGAVMDSASRQWEQMLRERHGFSGAHTISPAWPVLKRLVDDARAALAAHTADREEE